MLASLAHEINNPLQSLVDLLYLVESELPLTAQGRHLLKLAQEEARRISLIAREAMNGLRNSTNPIRTNVPLVLASVLEFYRSRFELRGISIDSRYCPDADLAIDSGPLRQMFSNLLINAADAMPTGGTIHARISLAQEWSGRARQGLRLTIADNGCGIPSGDLPKILLPFFSTKGPYGTGIGLSLVNATVRKHGGVMRVRSCTREGRCGTVFTVFLPA